MVAVLAISDSSRASLLAGPRPARDEHAHRLARASRSSATTPTCPTRRVGDDPADPPGPRRRAPRPPLDATRPPDRPDRPRRDRRHVGHGRRPVAARHARRDGRERPLPRRGARALPDGRPRVDRRATASASPTSTTPSHVCIGGRWFTVVGILDELPLAPELDRAALIGMPAAETYLGVDDSPSTVYVRVDPAHVDEVQAVLGATANPERPGGRQRRAPVRRASRRGLPRRPRSRRCSSGSARWRWASGRWGSRT